MRHIITLSCWSSKYCDQWIQPKAIQKIWTDRLMQYSLQLNVEKTEFLITEPNETDMITISDYNMLRTERLKHLRVMISVSDELSHRIILRISLVWWWDAPQPTRNLPWLCSLCCRLFKTISKQTLKATNATLCYRDVDASLEEWHGWLYLNREDLPNNQTDGEGTKGRLTQLPKQTSWTLRSGKGLRTQSRWANFFAKHSIKILCCWRYSD